MFQKSTVKKKELSKTSLNYLKPDDDEIRAELEAMTGLEYNLPTDPVQDPLDVPAISLRRSRASTKSQKSEKIIAMEAAPRERIEVESQIPTYSSTASARELQGIIRQAGATSEDKYKILEARDRLMRFKQVKSHSLETAKKTRGTCPDMCPEKERLMREFQRQVSPYEQVEGQEYRICHETAVKQYSRSSADQAEPMPQDLRPVSSLKMTMSYLLHEIVNLCDEDGTNLAEWYHFVWDRTRGIRKDITLQDLCCLDTVELVEQCARFHIVCSERLCAEETAVFDKKINTENLTKCLQTLKYMYHDLRLHGITCKNEAEFRGYIILLNLDNMSFMWDLQELPKAIQTSPEVKFAIQVFSSIQSNNYTRFFKLVKRTTYLNACLMLRYFFQVRVKGLTVMVKAYCRTTSTAYPLYEFMDILGFDDENEAIAFCENAELNISSDELNIILNRQNANLPPPVMETGRATSLVEAKRMKMGYSYGQAISGDRMPEQLYLNHVPHDSFNDRGYLKPEAVNASDQNLGIVEAEEERDPYEYMEDETEALPPLRHKVFKIHLPEDNGEDNEEDELDEEEIEDEGEDEAEEDYDDADNGDNDELSKTPQVFLPITSKPTPNIFKDFIFSAGESQSSKGSKDSPFTPKSMENSPFASKSEFSFTAAKKTNIFTESDASKLFFTDSAFGTKKLEGQSIFSGASQGNIFAKTVPAQPLHSTHKSENIFKIPSPAKRRESPTKQRTSLDLGEEGKKEENEEALRKSLAREQHLQEIEKNAKKYVSEVENEVIHDICSTILKEEMEKVKVFERISQKVAEELIREIALAECKAVLNHELYIQKRMKEVSERIKNRMTRKFYKIWQRNAAKKRAQREALDHTPVWLPKYPLDACAKSLYRKDQDLVIQNMRRRSNKPHDDDLKYISPVELKIYYGLKENAKTLDTDPTSIMFWKLVISWPQLANRVLLWRYKNIMNQYLCPGNCRMDPIIKTYKRNPFETLNICIKHCEGPAGEDDVLGMDGLFFIATSDEDPKTVVRRLTKTVLWRQKLMPIPLVFIILGEDAGGKSITPTTELKSLQRAEYISEYTVHHEKLLDEASILKLTQTAVLWLSLNRSSPIPLEMDYLRDLIDNCLIDELWLRISGHAPFNAALQAASEDPKFIVDLHNEAVNRLTDIILDAESLMYTDFPKELKPLLPKEFDLPCGYEYFQNDWKNEETRENIERILEGFILPPWPFDWPITNTMELHKCVNRYCNSTLGRSNYDSVSCNILSNIFFMSNSNEKPRFVHILTEIIRGKTRVLETELSVVYDKNHVKLFRTLPWWFKSRIFLNYEAQLAANVAESAHETSVIKRRRLQEQEDKENHEISMAIEEFDNTRFDENQSMVKSLLDETKNQHSEVQRITDRLDALLEKQRLANLKFQEKLEAALRSEPACT